MCDDALLYYDNVNLLSAVSCLFDLQLPVRQSSLCSQCALYVTVHRKRGYQGYFIKIEFFALGYPLPSRKYVSMIFIAKCALEIVL